MPLIRKHVLYIIIIPTLTHCCYTIISAIETCFKINDHVHVYNFNSHINHYERQSTINHTHRHTYIKYLPAFKQ